MSKKAYVGVAIGDIHFGAFSSKELYDELQIFIKYLKSMKIIDYLVVCGDLFDGKIYMSSEHATYAFAFINELVAICAEKKAKLRIVKGTESHDSKQLNILKYISGTNCDIKIINTVTSEQLFDDLNVLYIPEEYMGDPEEYYKDYFSSTYDHIFGHGLVNEVAFVAKTQESETTMSKAPIFKSKDLIAICKGPIFLGHIHKPQCINERLFYTGSYSRWAFGEEEDKGFIVFTYRPDNGAFKTEFIKNTLARTFNTMVVDYGSKVRNIPEDKQIEYVLSLVKNIECHKLRIIFNIPEDCENPALLVGLLNDTFGKMDMVKIVINNNSKEEKKKKEFELKMKTLVDTYHFIFDKGMPPEEKISKYIKTRYNKDISVDQMREYLYNKLKF